MGTFGRADQRGTGRPANAVSRATVRALAVNGIRALVSNRANSPSVATCLTTNARSIGRSVDEASFLSVTSRARGARSASGGTEPM